jgi:hypothetical protein
MVVLILKVPAGLGSWRGGNVMLPAQPVMRLTVMIVFAILGRDVTLTTWYIREK